jgi:hypothetical protein
VKSELARRYHITCREAPVLHILPSRSIAARNVCEGVWPASLLCLPGAPASGEQQKKKRKKQCVAQPGWDQACASGLVSRE